MVMGLRMKKIEKIRIYKDEKFSLQANTRAFGYDENEIDIARKINEIIDRLNKE